MYGKTPYMGLSVFHPSKNHSNEIMINRINSDLANGFGNLVSRTVAMVEKYFGGTLPTEREGGEFDDDLIATATALKSSVDDFIDKTQLNNALAEIFKVVSRANKYIDETAPWVIAKDETKIRQLHETMEAAVQTAADAEKWIALMKQYVNPVELTAELLNTLIEKITVHEAVKGEDGSREQEVEIYYRFIGKID